MVDWKSVGGRKFFLKIPASCWVVPALEQGIRAFLLLLGKAEHNIQLLKAQKWESVKVSVVYVFTRWLLGSIGSHSIQKKNKKESRSQ